MKPINQTASATGAGGDRHRRRVMRAGPRGASSGFVGTSIVILSSFALSTLAMNWGKKIQESRNKHNHS